MEKVPESLKNRIFDRRIVPFIGAGVSKAVQRLDGRPLFPTWQELLLTGARLLEREQQTGQAGLVEAMLNIPKPDFPQTASVLREHLGALWLRFLKQELDPSRYEVAENSLALARATWALGSNLIVTTNYDRVLHWSCPASIRDDLDVWDIQATAEQLNLQQEGRVEMPTIWHLHGRIRNVAKMILTEEDFQDLYSPADPEGSCYAPALSTLRNQLATRSMLFIGFSLNDSYFSNELQQVLELFGGNPGPHYVLAHKDAPQMRSLPVTTITFSDYGEPLVRFVHKLSEFTPSPEETVVLDFKLAADQKPRGPQPRYINDENRKLSEALEAAYLQFEGLVSEGLDSSEARDRILTLRRKIREGGHLQAGDFLLQGRFKLIEKIGRGGFAIVWKAYDRTNHDLVAVKVLHGQFQEDKTRRERFFRGARKMKSLQHQYIARVVEPCCTEEGYHYFVMEYVGEFDLHKAILKGRLRQDESIEIILKTAEALQVAHSKGIIHRDVKPENILLSRSNNPKLTDFDLVRAKDTTGGTKTGMVGTVVYAAPEAMERGNDAAEPADIFGLGMTAVFALHGKELPFSHVMKDVSTFIKNLDAPAVIKEVLTKSTRWQTERRHRTMVEFYRELQNAVILAAVSPESEGVATTEDAVLVLQPDAGTRSVFRVDSRSPTMIGRDIKEVNIALSDPLVSLRHCCLDPQGGIFVLIDLGSANKTFVNNVPVARHELSNGDIIQLGSARLEFRTGEEVRRLLTDELDETLIGTPPDVEDFSVEDR